VGSVGLQAPPPKGDRTLVSAAVLAKVAVLVFLVWDDRAALRVAVVWAALHAVAVRVALRVAVVWAAVRAALLARTTSKEGMGIQTHHARFLKHLVLSVLLLLSHRTSVHM
jgi:hypothetical protein